MDNKDLTSCCGIYCPDCMWYRNSFSQPAKNLKDALDEVDFERYASVKSPFGAELEFYQEFLDILNFIARNDCLEPCRIGGGCGGHPCKIMKCAEERKLEDEQKDKERGSEDKVDRKKTQEEDTGVQEGRKGTKAQEQE